MKAEGRRKKEEAAELRARTNVGYEAIPIREALTPRNERVAPADYPELPYIGLDDKETVVKHPHKPEAERFWNFPIGAI